MNEIDRVVGQRVRAARIARGVSQSDLGEQVGVRFQQIQKYETGQNRISASRLLAIARVLDTPIEYFFDGVGALGEDVGDDTADRAMIDMMSDQDYLSLARGFMSLSDRQRKAVLSIVLSMASPQDAPQRGS